MLDLQAKYRDLEVRVTALEQATVRSVGPNVLSKIDETRAEMKLGFANVDRQIRALAEKLEIQDGKIENLARETASRIESLAKETAERFKAVDERFDRLEAVLIRIESRLPDQQLN